MESAYIRRPGFRVTLDVACHALKASCSRRILQLDTYPIMERLTAFLTDNSHVAERTEYVESGTEREDGHGPLDVTKGHDKDVGKKREPPPGRGESLFREMDWRQDP